MTTQLNVITLGVFMRLMYNSIERFVTQGVKICNIGIFVPEDAVSIP